MYIPALAFHRPIDVDLFKACYTWNVLDGMFMYSLSVNYSERSEVSTRARESFRMASRRIFRVHLNCLSYSLQRFRPCRHVLLSQKLWPPSRWSCKAYKPYGSAGLCLPGKSMFSWPKMIAPSWPKVVRPVADGKDVARCGLSIGLFLAPLFHD